MRSRCHNWLLVLLGIPLYTACVTTQTQSKIPRPADTISGYEDFLLRYPHAPFSDEARLRLVKLYKEEGCRSFRVLEVELSSEKQAFLESIDMRSLTPNVSEASPKKGWVFVIVHFALENFKASELEIRNEDFVLIDREGNQVNSYTPGFPYRDSNNNLCFAWSSGGTRSCPIKDGKLNEKTLFLVRSDNVKGSEIRICNRTVPLDSIIKRERAGKQ